jgi:hypothetical protein
MADDVFPALAIVLIVLALCRGRIFLGHQRDNGWLHPCVGGRTGLGPSCKGLRGLINRNGRFRAATSLLSTAPRRLPAPERTRTIRTSVSSIAPIRMRRIAVRTIAIGAWPSAVPDIRQFAKLDHWSLPTNAAFA